MPAAKIREGPPPATPSEGYALWATVATPSIPKIIDDAGAAYALAMLERAQTFTAAQTFAPTSTSTKAVTVNAPSSVSVSIFEVQYNGVSRAYIAPTATANQMGLQAVDLGTNIGPAVVIDRNNNASTPASGSVRITNRAGTDYYIWVDSTGKLRIGTTAPTNANDATGTIVGTQS